jgi:hypothetical protein
MQRHDRDPAAVRASEPLPRPAAGVATEMKAGLESLIETYEADSALLAKRLERLKEWREQQKEGRRTESAPFYTVREKLAPNPRIGAERREASAGHRILRRRFFGDP